MASYSQSIYGNGSGPIITNVTRYGVPAVLPNGCSGLELEKFAASRRAYTRDHKGIYFCVEFSVDEGPRLFTHEDLIRRMYHG